MNQTLFNSLPGNARLTLKEIAELMGIGHSTLTKRMNKAGIGQNCQLFVKTIISDGKGRGALKIFVPKSNVPKFLKLMALIESNEKELPREKV